MRQWLQHSEFFPYGLDSFSLYVSFQQTWRQTFSVLIAIIINRFFQIYLQHLNLNKSIFWFCFITEMLVSSYQSFLLLLDQRETVRAENLIRSSFVRHYRRRLSYFSFWPQTKLTRLLGWHFFCFQDCSLIWIMSETKHKWPDSDHQHRAVPLSKHQNSSYTGTAMLLTTQLTFQLSAEYKNTWWVITVHFFQQALIKNCEF